MKRLIFAAMMAASLTLGACDIGAVQSPGSVANRTVLDEQIGSAVELAYKAARLLVELGVDTGRIKGQNALKADAFIVRAYSATLAVQEAYRAGNAVSYKAAAEHATATIAQLTALAQ